MMYVQECGTNCEVENILQCKYKLKRLKWVLLFKSCFAFPYIDAIAYMFLLLLSLADVFGYFLSLQGEELEPVFFLGISG